MARTKYRKVYCNKIIAYMSLGKSLNQFAHHISVVKATLDRWEDNHADFAYAMERAKQASLSYWEDKLEDMIMDREVNTPLVKLLFAHRFRWFDSRPKDLEIEPIEQPEVRITVVANNRAPFELKEDQKANQSIH